MLFLSFLPSYHSFFGMFLLLADTKMRYRNNFWYPFGSFVIRPKHAHAICSVIQTIFLVWKENFLALSRSYILRHKYSIKYEKKIQLHCFKAHHIISSENETQKKIFNVTKKGRCTKKSWKIHNVVHRAKRD